MVEPFIGTGILSMSLPRAIHWIVISALFVLLLVGITLLFYFLNWSWIIYAVISGVIFGLLVGLVILVKVSIKLQIAAVGAFTGMGVDLAATATRESGPAAALNSLATLVANTVHAATGAAQQTGLPNSIELPLSVGIWVFIAVLAITMLIGSLEKEVT